MAYSSDEVQDALSCLNIKFDIGQSQHKNRNPCAENAIKEGHLAINKIGNPQYLDAKAVALVARHLNDKIRDQGLSSREFLQGEVWLTAR